MVPSISGVIVNESMTHWNEVLLRWCAIVEQWCRIASPDRPWWHIAIPNAGLIASAAIASGYAALVESDVPKEGRRGARSDLWIQFSRQDEKGAAEEFVELKRSALSDGRIELGPLDQAMNDAAIICWNCRAKIGACIYHVNGGGDGSFLRRLVDEVSSKTQADAVAWIFPGHFINAPHDGKIAPGMILALKIAKKQ
ncbi:MAG TPA: hypothetical protein VMU80_26565 [Bryobacteraceae bacterium]|nr:hypothetical protein [Bryobacteraceae bacterium]